VSAPDDDLFGDAPELAGCGSLSVDLLRHVAASRVDPRIRVDGLALAHVVLCPRCKASVDRLEGHKRLRAELERQATAGAGSGERPGDWTGSTGIEAGTAQIPGYRLEGEIHRGGQGTVFHAVQLATRRACAVKMLIGGRFASTSQRQRFEREVEVIAALRHPSIVTLYESGVSRDAEPWFAMEFVDGERIDQFLARTRPSVREIAGLMREIAGAIAYAHRRGVIHRDIKPGNILIDREGCPRVLDFGLARATGSRAEIDAGAGSTQVGEFVGTFAYAAPEQLSSDPHGIDSRCDLYALGVVFYECLAGVSPFAKARSLAELIDQKSRGIVPRLRLAAPGTVDHDIEIIVMRLLAPDPARRYDTADALVEDITRWLDGRPILARDDSFWYVASKTVRRHSVISTLAGILVVTVLSSVVALAIAYQRAERERTRAELERARVERGYRSFRDALESADPELGVGTSEMRVAEFLGVVEKQVRAELSTEPELLAEVLQTLGLIQLGFDESLRASDAIFRAYEIIRSGHEAGRVSDSQRAAAATALAKLKFADDDFAGSEAAYREALEFLIRISGPNSSDVVDTERQLASTLRAQGKFDAAREMLDRALEHSQQLPEGKDGAVVRAGVLNGRGVLASSQHDDRAALAEFTRALDTIRPHVAPDDFRIGRTLFSMARAQERLGQFVEAELNALRAVEILSLRKGKAARSTQAAVELLDSIRESRREAPASPEGT